MLTALKLIELCGLQESTNSAFLGHDRHMSEQPQTGHQAVHGGAPFGENVIANLEARFKETAVGRTAHTEEQAEPMIAETAAIGAHNPLAALGLQPQMSHTQQPSREEDLSLDRAGTSSGYHGAPNRKKRQLGSTLRPAAEQHGGYGSKRKTPLSKAQHKFAIRESSLTAGEQTSTKTAVPDILKTLKGLDVQTPRFDAFHCWQSRIYISNVNGLLTQPMCIPY